MQFRPHKLLAALLAIVLVFGPAGGALAVHVCDTSGSDRSMATAHAAHASVADLGETASGGKCQGCSPDCCNGALCSANACGAGPMALTGAFELQMSWHAADLSPVPVQVASRERLTSPYRPPRA